MSKKQLATAAFTYWNNRIAPVLDTACDIHIVVTKDGRIVRESRETLSESNPVRKILHLHKIGIDTLICGAVSRSLYELTTAYGIHVIPFVAGDLHEVIRAWLDDAIENDAFAMPGCCGARWLRNNHKQTQEFNSMKGKGRGFGAGKGQGPGRRQGQETGESQGQGGGQGTGRRYTTGDDVTVRPTGTCVCPRCGFNKTHERGKPCFEQRCPTCNIPLIRQ